MSTSLQGTGGATDEDASVLASTAHAATIDARGLDDTGDLASAATVAAGVAVALSQPPPGAGRSTLGRTTVFPRVVPGDVPELVHDERVRYERLRTLGAGAMGEVSLVEDRDIGRTVATKHLIASADPGAVVRFIDEVRTVGRLEHPNIVPIHDVGLDDDGRYYFVMKYVEGETLESIIERLDKGDPDAHREWTIEARIDLFMRILHALEFAHEKGIVHRDVKPANVMVGRFGEVVLMDWGIAKSVGSSTKPEPAPAATEGEGDVRERLYRTRQGALVGTPAYMAPEQARGDNDAVDARTDLYSATVLFHELLSLRHYLHEETTLAGMLRAITKDELSARTLFPIKHPDYPAPPAELLHVVAKGLQKDPAERYQSAAEMIARLQRVLDGTFPIQCRITFMKRLTRELGRFVDRRPLVAFTTFVAVVVLTLALAVTFAWAVRAALG